VRRIYIFAIALLAGVALLSVHSWMAVPADAMSNDPVPTGTLLYFPAVSVPPPTPTPTPINTPTPTNTPFPPVNKIVYLCGSTQTNSNICIMNADGSRQKRIVTASGTSYYSQPRLSPDGSRVVFVKITTDTLQGTMWAIGTMNEDGSNYKEHFSGTDVFVYPEWSPDGSKLAFISTMDADDDNDIYMVNSDGSGASTKITSTTDMVYRDLSWSHDGAKIVFAAFKMGGPSGYRIWWMNSDGTSQTQLTTAGGYADQSPRWSPGDTHILFQRAFGPGQTGRQVSVMDPDGTNQTQLTSGGQHYYPCWSPNGEKILYNVGSGLAVMDTDGTNQVNLTNPDDDALEIWADWR